MNGQPRGEDQPGYGDIDKVIGLKNMIIEQFRSTTHIADTKKKLNSKRFNPEKDDIESFSAEVNAMLIIVGMNYVKTNNVTCRARADALLNIFPNWL